MQGRNCKEDFAAEQFPVDKWVRGGWEDVTLLRLQGGPASYKWKVWKRKMNLKIDDGTPSACLNMSATTRNRTLSGRSSLSPLFRWDFVERKGVNMSPVPCVVLFIKQSLQSNSSTCTSHWLSGAWSCTIPVHLPSSPDPLLHDRQRGISTAPKVSN